MDEQLILVDVNDVRVGYASKAECHNNQGMLHRAFSVFIFNSEKQLLLQKRSAKKLLWPLHWSNSVCSHPRKGESSEEAAGRRLKEELGISTHLEYLYKFKYHALYQDIGAEYEFCSVYFGYYDGRISSNKDEVAAWRHIDWHRVNAEIEENPDLFTPWFKMEWQYIYSNCEDGIGMGKYIA